LVDCVQDGYYRGSRRSWWSEGELVEKCQVVVRDKKAGYSKRRTMTAWLQDTGLRIGVTETKSETTQDREMKDL